MNRRSRKFDINVKKKNRNLADHKPMSKPKLGEPKIDIHGLDDIIRNWCSDFSFGVQKRRNYKMINDICKFKVLKRLMNNYIYAKLIIKENYYELIFKSKGSNSVNEMQKYIQELEQIEKRSNLQNNGIAETNQEKIERLSDHKIKMDFERFPEKRFEHIKNIGAKNGFSSAYVIELQARIKSSSSIVAYEGKSNEKSGKFKSRLFYVGITSNTLEERFFLSEKSHMNKRGRVFKHRKIRDDHPYEKSLEEIHSLTDKYGFHNKDGGGINSYQFEHYVAWAISMIGHDVWGTTMNELEEEIDFKQEWLGKAPFY